MGVIIFCSNQAEDRKYSCTREGCGSVGTKVEIEHIASSPVGMKITCDSELIGIEGRKLVFKVEAYDSKGLIGKGIHERFIVENEKFQEKTNKKLS